jgi:glycosyltransferase involved in cell wall biosynthesis
MDRPSSVAPEEYPRISIVTPSLNQGEFLEETLSSVVAQGYPNLEYVVIDGGSTDDSVGSIKRYAREITHWVSEPDLGHADALNKGFAVTTGEVMAWLNSSDIYYPWTLETVAAVFRDLPEVEWIQGVQSHIDFGLQPKEVGQGFCNRYDLLVRNRTIQQESVFWRRSLWERAGGQLDDALRLACDYGLWLRFSRHAPLYHVGTILAAFRHHEDRRGYVLRDDYDREARQLRDAERALLSERDRTRVALVTCLGRRGGHRASTLLAKSRLLDWYRYARVDYDFSQRKWRVG